MNTLHGISYEKKYPYENGDCVAEIPGGGFSVIVDGEFLRAKDGRRRSWGSLRKAYWWLTDARYKSTLSKGGN